MTKVRPATSVFLIFITLILLAGVIFTGIAARRDRQARQLRLVQRIVADLALSDLALTTEARYTRHPAITDKAVVGMDYPGALDHFPSTLFFAPVH